MSWSIVRTCRRCGTRAERPLRDLFDVVRVSHVLKLHFESPDADDGCPTCLPELGEQAKMDPLEWRALVARARGQRPS